MTDKPAFQRVLVKLSGEALMGDLEFGTDADTVSAIARQLKGIHDRGVEVAVVLGAGNIYRGLEGAAAGMDRSTADYMGMLATVINALALQDALEKNGVPTRVLTAIEMRSVAEPFIRRRAERHLDKGRVVVFAAGTGNPYFTTDTAAALRANEMGCDVLMKGTQVDGVYSADPKKDKNAKHFAKLSYHEVLVRDLKVMDASAIALSRENQIPILVFSLKEKDAITSAVCGKGKFTLITDKK